MNFSDQKEFEDAVSFLEEYINTWDDNEIKLQAIRQDMVKYRKFYETLLCVEWDCYDYIKHHSGFKSFHTEDECISANIQGVKLYIPLAGLYTIVPEDQVYSTIVNIRQMSSFSKTKQARNRVQDFGPQVYQICVVSDKWKFAIMVDSEDDANTLRPLIIKYFAGKGIAISETDIASIPDGKQYTLRVNKEECSGDCNKYMMLYFDFENKVKRELRDNNQVCPTVYAITFDLDKGIGTGPLNSKQVIIDGNSFSASRTDAYFKNSPIFIVINGNQNIVNIGSNNFNTIGSDNNIAGNSSTQIIKSIKPVVAKYVSTNPPTKESGIRKYHKEFKKATKTEINSKDFSAQMKDLGYASVRSRDHSFWHKVE